MLEESKNYSLSGRDKISRETIKKIYSFHISELGFCKLHQLTNLPFPCKNTIK